MIRGTFANIRLRNELVPGKEGNWTRPLPDRRGDDASTTPRCATRRTGIPLIVIAGKEYGTGSSRDWAAKGTLLLGVKAVIAESYERIHRSNLVGMGVLPLQFLPGESAAALGLTGRETFDIHGIADGLTPERAAHRDRHPRGRHDHRRSRPSPAIDSPVEVELLPQRRHPPDRAPTPAQRDGRLMGSDRA